MLLHRYNLSLMQMGGRLQQAVSMGCTMNYLTTLVMHVICLAKEPDL